MDDLYPNDGGALWTMPEERSKAERQEADKVYRSLPLMEDVITHLDERIAYFKSIDSLPTMESTEPHELLAMINARKFTVQALETERNTLMSLMKQYG